MKVITIIMSVALNILVCFNCVAMESNHVVATIIDHNNNDSITEKIGTEQSIIAIFGATPRYSMFELYRKTIQSDSNALLEQYTKNKQLKGVQNSIKKFVTSSIGENVTVQILNDYIAHTPEQKLFKLFFAAGLDYAKVQENVETLVKTAYKNMNDLHVYEQGEHELHLVHLLVPSYFSDSVGLQNNPECLYAFLKASAEFYQQLYEQVHSDGGIKVHILIPRLEYFINMLTQTVPINKHETNMTVVYKELVEQLACCQKYVLINLNKEELPNMVNCLKEKGIAKVAGIGVPITNSKGYPTTKFNPYLLKPDAKHTYQTSTLFNQQLEQYLQKQYKGHDRE